jgi:Na+/melibiose symporter-like transporter
VAAHPITSAAIFVLVAAAICCTLIVPIYAHITPKVGDFPFFYFYLLAYMPAVAIALWVATLLQRRLATPAGGSGSGSDAEATL